MRAVGKNVPRKEGAAKVTGAARYVDDLSFPGMLPGATVRSTISRGEILSIRHDLGRDGFTVVDLREIPGRNVVALIEEDQPCLAERAVRHAAEPILLLAHEEKEKLAAPKVEPRMVIAWIIRRRSSVMGSPPSSPTQAREADAAPKPCRWKPGPERRRTRLGSTTAYTDRSMSAPGPRGRSGSGTRHSRRRLRSS